MKILVTGGHVTPALAVIDRIREQYPSAEIVFVGRKYALDSERTLSLEFKEVTARNIVFYSLHAGRLTRLLSLRSFKSIVRVPVGFIQALRILRKERPARVLSFGGYIALPVAVMAWLLRIPVITHEQTISPGLANRLIGWFSRTIFYSFSESKNAFPPHKSRWVGNPVRSAVNKVIRKPFIVPLDMPVVYITGGSLGSHSINEHVFAVLSDLLTQAIVIHQTGDTREYADFERAEALRARMHPMFRERYFPVKHVFNDEIGYIYESSDMVIGRAGANTFFELLLLRKPAILIPLPWSAHKEQQKQAELFRAGGLGEVFEQKGNSRDFLATIFRMLKHLDQYQNKFKSLPFTLKHNAAEPIVKQLMAE